MTDLQNIRTIKVLFPKSYWKYAYYIPKTKYFKKPFYDYRLKYEYDNRKKTTFANANLS